MEYSTVKEMVHNYYWNDDLNCATTMLKSLSKAFDTPLHPQLIHAATGMHGAGKYGAQCGLVEGPLLFLGVWGAEMRCSQKLIVSHCHTFAQQFESHFSSLLCSKLRPEGFGDHLPAHHCESLTVEAVWFSIQYINTLR